MTLDNIMDLAKGETQDKTYQIGETSAKTGLVKTANGWRKPKTGAGAVSRKENPSTKHKSAYPNGYEEGDIDAAFEHEKRKNPNSSLAREDFQQMAKQSPEEFENVMNSVRKEHSAQKSSKSDPMEEMRNSNRPLSTMENQIDGGKYDDAIIESEGDSTAIMDIARDILSPAFDAVPNQEIPESWLKAARDQVRNRYTALRNDALGDSAPLTRDTKIKLSQIKK